VNGCFYHVYNRSLELKPILKKRRDCRRAIELINYYRFLDLPYSFSRLKRISAEERKILLDSLEKNGHPKVEIICFCLMPNHYHFLLRQVEDNGISSFLGDFQNGFTRYFNIKNGRVGHVFQGAFKAVLIENESQLLHLTRYIHLNPYSSMVVKELDQLLDYPWFSLPEYLGSREGFCQKEEILSLFSNVDQYKEFILNRADYQRQLETIKHLVERME
jgi:putative transposase